MDFASPDCQSVRRSFVERLEESCVDCGEIVLYVAKLMWGKVRALANVGTTSVTTAQPAE